MEKPIIFSTEMVKAILDGRKTQTRRVIEPQPGGIIEDCYLRPDGKFIWTHLPVGKGCGFGEPFACPYGQPGDVLWVREAWQDFPDEDGVFYFYAADEENAPFAYGDGGDPIYLKWKASRYMPRKAARIFLTVKSIRVERLQDITEDDARVEGWPCSSELFPAINTADKVMAWFKRLWDSINAKRGYGWHVNPWVWVVEFERLEVSP